MAVSFKEIFWPAQKLQHPIRARKLEGFLDHKTA